MIRKLAALAAGLLCLTGVQAHAGTITDHTDPKMRARGMADAPAIIAGMKLSCELADARYVGPADAKRDGKTVKGDSYEVACKSLQGFFLVRYKDGGFEQPVNCNMAEAIREKNKTYPACSLPGNRINHYWLTPYAKTRTPDCAVADARWIDEDAKHEGEFYELTCKNGTGAVYNIPHADKADQSVGLMSCLQTDGTPLACKRADHAAAVKALAPAAKAARGDCDLSDARYIGGKDGLSYYEAACATPPACARSVEMRRTRLPARTSRVASFAAVTVLPAPGVPTSRIALSFGVTGVKRNVWPRPEDSASVGFSIADCSALLTMRVRIAM